jgi:hypothetical protein
MYTKIKMPQGNLLLAEFKSIASFLELDKWYNLNDATQRL